MENDIKNTQSRTDYDVQQDQQLRRLLAAQDDVWRIFRVMAEFVDGFTLMAKQKKLISRRNLMDPLLILHGIRHVK